MSMEMDSGDMSPTYDTEFASVSGVGASSFNSGIGKRERWSAAALRLMYTPGYAIVYGLIGLLCLGMFAWSLAVSEISEAYIAVDVIVNIIITAEVMLRVFALRCRSFLISWVNRFDIFVLVVCWSCSIFEIVAFHTDSIDREKFVASSGAVLVAIRAVVQLCRLFIVVNVQRQRRKTGMLDMEGDYLMVDDSDQSQSKSLYAASQAQDFYMPYEDGDSGLMN